MSAKPTFPHNELQSMGHDNPTATMLHMGFSVLIDAVNRGAELQAAAIMVASGWLPDHAVERVADLAKHLDGAA